MENKLTEESGRIFESEDKRPQVKELFINHKKVLPKLEKLLDECNSHWEYEDPVYRFYHQSLKVYLLQEWFRFGVGPVVLRFGVEPS